MEIAVRAADHVVTMYGEAIGCPEGSSVVALTDDQATALRAVFAQPNGGCTFINGLFAPLPVPPATPTPDPLKPYRDALSTAADADAGLSADTKTALQNLLAAMAPR